MKPIREMSALDLLEVHCQALQAQNERLREALEQIAYGKTTRGHAVDGQAVARRALSGDGSVSQPAGEHR